MFEDRRRTGNAVDSKIPDFKNNFENWSRENGNIAAALKKELLDLAGVEEPELKDYGFDFLHIPLKDLADFSTGCGQIGNKPFTAKFINFLQINGVDFVVALGNSSAFEISSAAINISSGNVAEIEGMISSGNGSLRGEESRVDGWSVFESE
jgi:hypothetical protein